MPCTMRSSSPESGFAWDDISSRRNGIEMLVFAVTSAPGIRRLRLLNCPPLDFRQQVFLV